MRHRKGDSEGYLSGIFDLGVIDGEGKFYKDVIGYARPFRINEKPKAFVVGMQKYDESLGLPSKDSYMYPDSTLLIDEVRVYSCALTDDEIMSSYDRMLSGDEQGLSLYWPMNEGYQTGYVYDRSRTNSVPNNAHGKAVSGVSYTDDSPNQTGQVSCYGLTDQ